MKLFNLLISITILLFTSCGTITTSLSYPQNNKKVTEIDFTEKIVKIETKGSCGDNLILNEALNLEKKNNGDTIRLVNIIEQRREEIFLFFSVSEEVCYTYDVVFYTK